ncbi:unnamed protein product [Soboliphyme baturini]|uniref:Exocyst complex component 7 n=1 Tax=Soboliphyme baturini TaxID=241478 RepID=A0A183J5U0_9BILA|nr:unnamed protein product [Soboliphyme baturini]
MKGTKTVTPSFKDIQDLLNQEEEWLKRLKDSLAKAENLKNSMTSILDNFEHRLFRLESTVMPMYKYTGYLQQKQQSGLVSEVVILCNVSYSDISRTLKVIDNVMNLYSMASEANSILKDLHPSENLENYLKYMGHLKDAICFFRTDDVYKNQMEHMKSTYEFGISALEQEFKNVLRKESVVVKASDVLDCISDGYDSVTEKVQELELITADGMETLSRISQWLIDSSYATNYLNIYGELRATVDLQTLQR